MSPDPGVVARDLPAKLSCLLCGRVGYHTQTGYANRLCAASVDQQLILAVSAKLFRLTTCFCDILTKSKMDCKTPLVVTVVAALCAVLVLAAEDGGCPPKMCETVKMKCISQDSCNGTLFMGGPNCGCCPECVPFRGEGAQCDIEEIPVSASKASESVKEALPVAKADLKENLKEKKAPNVCGSGLTCLQGTCVALF
ncbi:hypothetical protein LSTR_LSTR004965 [Laodelphax striatellus]|uniref:Uncharacterized protein n=1 Tax=Laodelphax striatellus TaxID=195883 RepID=A0A482XMW1_LAOST|nr:hypothetical protein LSTR_LSTR004965 [Laodelphax striatellus]